MSETYATNYIPIGVQEDNESLLFEMYINSVSNRIKTLQNPNTNDQKRWIWELLQNAKDSIAKSIDKTNIEVEVIAEDDCITFRHNGEPFTPKALNSLIYQKSGDKRGNAESTGRYGTGFLTTHTLSQKVFVESILRDKDGSLHGINVILHREGKDDDELLEGIKKTLQSQKFKPNPDNNWTTFKYELKTPLNRESAAAGIDSLENNVFFTLSFADKISSIKIVNKDITKTIKKTEEIIFGELKIVRFLVLENEKETKISVIVANETIPNGELTKRYKHPRNLRVSVAIQVLEESKVILPISKATPYLHCVFPLIGTEGFYFPVVVNSPDFEPHPERERVFLSGDDFKKITNDQTDETTEQITDTGINKTILVRAVELYSKLLVYFSENSWKNIHFLATGAKKTPSQDKDFDADWYKERIQAELKRIILDVPIVQTANGLQKLDCIYFPQGNEKEMNKIWEFTNDINPEKLPLLELVDDWTKLIWKGCHSQTVKELSKQVSGFGNIFALNKEVNWLNNLLCFIVEAEKDCLIEFALIPNVNGDFKTLDYENLSKDSGLPSPSFMILSAFDINWKDIIVIKGVDAVSIPLNKGLKEFSDEVNAQIRQRAKNNDENLLSSIFPLLSLIPTKNNNISVEFIEKRKFIWSVSKVIFRSEESETFEGDNLDEILWERCDEWIIPEMIKKVSAQNSINGLTLLNENLDTEWLNTFVGFVSSYINVDLFNQPDYKILPNQYGVFKVKSCLSKDESIPIELKDEVFVELGVDLKDELLHERINKFTPENVTHITEVATRINDLLRNQDTEQTIKDKVVFRLISLQSDVQHPFQEKLWNYARVMYGNMILPALVPLSNSHPTLWSETNTYLISKIVTDIEVFESTETDGEIKSSVTLFSDYLCGVSTAEKLNWNDFAIIWVSDFIDFLHKNELKIGTIVPNQNNKFCILDKLYKDEDIHKDLKDILLKLDISEDFRDILKHEGITTQPIHPKDSKDIARKINEIVKNDYKAQRSDEQFKEAVKLLVVDWFNKPYYSSDLHKEFGYGKTDKINRELFEWSYEHRFELETNVLSTVSERKHLYGLNNRIRELNIPFEDIEIVSKNVLDSMKAEIQRLTTESSNVVANELLAKFNLTEDRIKSLLEIEETVKQSKESNGISLNLIPFKGFNVGVEDERTDWKQIAIILYQILHQDFIEPLKDAGLNYEEFRILVAKYKNNEILIKSDSFAATEVPETFDKVGYEDGITAIAILKVLSHLTEKLGYEIIEVDSIFSTIIKVKNKGEEFMIVIRPSNGKRYKLYQKEKEVLSHKKSELWLSNGFEVGQETFYSLIGRIIGTRFIPMESFVPGRQIG